MGKKQIRITEADLHKIVEEAARRAIMEGQFDLEMGQAENKFEDIVEYYSGNEGELVSRLWYFIGTLGQKPQFINYMETNGDLQGMGDDMEEDLPGLNDPHGLVR